MPPQKFWCGKDQDLLGLIIFFPLVALLYKLLCVAI